MAAALWLGGAGVARAQEAPASPAPAPARAEGVDEEAVTSPDQAVESYLERLGLKRLLADQLEKRISQTPKDLRLSLAERLGRLYVDLLGAATTTAERQHWEDKARALLVLAPDADSFDLRLSLNKAVYTRAEDIAERQRLRMATPDEVADAERSFRALVTQFQEIATKANRRVENLEHVEQSGEATDAALAELSDGRRQRSLAFYYAGWSNYYLSMLTRAEQPAMDATRSFGWLLNSSGGRPPAPDRVPPAMFQYEHVARAAIGCGLCASLRGNDTEALRWLDAVEQSTDTPEGVRDQIVGRRFVVLGQAKRWADLDILVRKTRKADRRGGGKDLTPLPTVLARLLAVMTLEADKRVAGGPIEALAKIALGDLVARKEVAQVLDLVSRYGTSALGDAGFISNYVRALQAYDTARKAHEAEAGTSAGSDENAAEEPAKSPAVINQYRAAATMFEAAGRESDAAEFAVERARAAVMHGRSLFYANDPNAAADVFINAWNLIGKTPAGEEPLWLAVLSLEHSARQNQNEAIRKRLNETVTLFLQHYPESERAPRLTLMQVSLGALGDDEALKVLSAVPKESPVYDAARRQVARILYNRFRAARGPERDFAGARFVAVGEEVLAADRKAAMEAKPEEAKQAAERVIVRSRQLLDALLGVSTPDVARAESVMKILAGVAAFSGTDLKPNLPELTYRELQIAVARGADEPVEDAIKRLLTLNDPGAQFQAAGERLAYRHFAGKFHPGVDDSTASLDAARAVVRHGVRVIDRVGRDPAKIRETGMLSVYSTVAGAAADIAKRTGDNAMRDLAISLNKNLLAVQPRTESALRSLADLAESAGDVPTAVGAWRTLLEAGQTGSEPWFEAKYNIIRLLAKVDVARARAAMKEHRILYPDCGPEPWGPKLRDLDASLGSGSTPAPAPAASSPQAPPPAGAPGKNGGTP
jgi:hypothetical protein